MIDPNYYLYEFLVTYWRKVFLRCFFLIPDREITVNPNLEQNP